MSGIFYTAFLSMLRRLWGRAPGDRGRRIREAFVRRTSEDSARLGVWQTPVMYNTEKGEHKMRLGILGTGMMANLLMPAIKKLDFDYVAVLGRRESEEKVKALCRDNGLDAWYLDYEELLGSDVDVIYVALPNDLHWEFAKKALIWGKHVIIEKPVTACLAQLEDLAETAREQRKMIFEAMTIHYLPAYRSLREHLAEIGDVRLMTVNYSKYSSRYDAFRAGRVLPAFDPERAGGAMMDLNVYNVHGAVGLFGKPGSVTYKANMERGIDVSGVLTMDYGAFKVCAAAAKDSNAPASCVIQGTEGYIRIPRPMSQMDGYEIVNNKGEVTEYRPDSQEYRLCYEFKEFQRMIREQDRAGEQAMLDVSLMAAQVMEEARRQVGLK